MRTPVFALATLALSGAAWAQSSVTLSGIIDQTLTHGAGQGAGSSKKTQLGNSGYLSSRIVLRGTEDLGGGMAASFWLEAGLATDNGMGGATNTNNQASGTAAAPAGTQGITFNRRSTVSLTGPWGEFRLGRDHTPHFWNLANSDPFTGNGVGSNQTFNSQAASLYPAGIGATGPIIRTSNSIGYLTPSRLGGFYAHGQYYLGENAQNGAATEDDGTGYNLRLGYAKGPLNVAVATNTTQYASGDVRSSNAMAIYDFGVVKLMGTLTRDRVDAPTGTRNGRGDLIGATAPLGPGVIRAAYSRYRMDTATNPASRKLAIGYVYPLSKRTMLYGTWARVSNNGSAAMALNGSTTAAGASSRGFDLGLMHSF